MTNIIFVVAILFFTSISVGIVGNVIGIGGGILLVPFFLLYMHLSPVKASGLSLFTILASSSGGSSKFIKEKIIDFKLYLMIVIFAVPGVIAGSILSKYIKTDEFKGIFSLIIVIIGVFSLAATNIQTKKAENEIDLNKVKSDDDANSFNIKKNKEINNKESGNENIKTSSGSGRNRNCKLQSIIIYLKHIHIYISSDIKRRRIDGAGNIFDYYIKKPLIINFFSLIAGFISGFIGIGIGGITGTFLTAVEQIPPRIAFSTVILAMILTSIVGGFIHLSYMKFSSDAIIIYLIPLMIGAVIGSQLGVHISKLLKSRTLRLYQGWIIITLGFLMFAISYIK
ncbi:MAG: sulfite exporter TauE/SafE family protein [bacterium]